MQIKGSNRIFNFRMVISGKYIDYMIFAVKIKVVEHVTSLQKKENGIFLDIFDLFD